MKVLSKSNYNFRQIWVHKTQCVHRMRLRPFLPNDETENVRANRKDLCTDASAVEGAHIFDKNLPVTHKDTSDEESEGKTFQINHQIESPTFSEVYAPEVFARRASIKRDTPLGRHRQTLNRTQHPPMEIDENQGERVPWTLVPERDQNYERNSPDVSHKSTRHMKNTQAETNTTTGTSGSTETPYNLQANQTPKKYTDSLIHQTTEACAALRPVGTQRDGTRTHSSQ